MCIFLLRLLVSKVGPKEPRGGAGDDANCRENNEEEKRRVKEAQNNPESRRVSQGKQKLQKRKARRLPALAAHGVEVRPTRGGRAGGSYSNTLPNIRQSFSSRLGPGRFCTGVLRRRKRAVTVMCM